MDYPWTTVGCLLSTRGLPWTTYCLPVDCHVLVWLGVCGLPVGQPCLMPASGTIHLYVRQLYNKFKRFWVWIPIILGLKSYDFLYYISEFPWLASRCFCWPPVDYPLNSLTNRWTPWPPVDYLLNSLTTHWLPVELVDQPSHFRWTCRLPVELVDHPWNYPWTIPWTPWPPMD